MDEESPSPCATAISCLFSYYYLFYLNCLNQQCLAQKEKQTGRQNNAYGAFFHAVTLTIMKLRSTTVHITLLAPAFVT